MCESNETALIILLSSAESESGAGPSNRNRSEEIFDPIYTDKMIKKESQECDSENSIEGDVFYDSNEPTMEDYGVDDENAEMEEGEEDDEMDDCSNQSTGHDLKLKPVPVDKKASITCQLCGEVFDQIGLFELHMKKYSSVMVTLK